MGRARKLGTLTLRMNGDLVGHLTQARGERLRFAYSPNWLRSDHATPISRSLPLGATAYQDARVESFFDNLLPDGEAIRQRMQARFDTPSTRPFDLLAAIGRDCVGAIQLLPDDEEVDVRRIDARPITSREIGALVRSLASAPLGMRDDDDFRISLAGAHEKTALLRHEGRWKRPQGATPSSHVLKPAIGPLRGGPDLSDSVETEWLSLKLAGALGLPVAKADIQRFDGEPVLVVERFDRQWSRDRSWLLRLPQEDLCQALGEPPARKYESDGGPGIRDVMRVLLDADAPSTDRATFFRANVVSWLLAGIDAHAKNYSLFLDPGGGLRLTPLYDVVSAYPALARRQLPKQKIKLAMAAIATKHHYRWAEIRRAHWVSTAEACGMPARDADAILDDLASRLDPTLSAVAKLVPRDFAQGVSEPIFEGVRAMRTRL